MSLQEAYIESYQAALAREGEEMVQVIRQYLRRRGKEASGELIQSIGYEVEGYRLILKAEAEHAIYVHEGTDPHWPPSGALEGWVRQVGFAPGLSIETRDYLARKSVAEKGTEALPFIDDPLVQNARRIADQLENKIIADLNSEAQA